MEPSGMWGEETLQIMYFTHVHPANQSGLLLRPLATASQPVVIPGMGLKVEVEVSPGGRLWAAVGVMAGENLQDKAVGTSEI